MSTIYERIKHLCDTRNIAVTTLEKELEFGRGSIGKLKNGINTSSARLQKIADYFGVSLGYLMGTEEEEPNAVDKEKNLIVLDDDALELLEELKTRPEMRTLFSVSKKATKEDIMKAVKIIEALKGDD